MWCYVDYIILENFLRIPFKEGTLVCMHGGGGMEGNIGVSV